MKSTVSLLVASPPSRRDGIGSLFRLWNVMGSEMQRIDALAIFAKVGDLGFISGAANSFSVKLGKHEMVRALEIRAELPRTPVGKIEKKTLYEEEKRNAAGGA